MATEPKRLYRSFTNKMIAGVCGGVAEYFNIDPTVVRLLFVLGFFLGTATFWVYIVMWVLIPEEPNATPPTPTVK